MTLFLSYASEDKDVAEQIYLSLLGAGYDVFFDQTSLPPGGDYNSRIREAICRSDLFIFLISPNSVKEASYTLTELKFAQEKWRVPNSKILPVIVSDTNFDTIPNYLKSITVQEPKGNIAAEVANEVIKISVRDMKSEKHMFERLISQKSLSKILSLPLWGGVATIVAIAALVLSLLADDKSQQSEANKQSISNGDNNVQIQGTGNSVTK